MFKVERDFAVLPDVPVPRRKPARTIPPADPAFAFLDANDSLSAGLSSYVRVPIEAEPVILGCPFLGHALATGGADYNEPLWHMTTLCATFMQYGDVLAHRFGNKHSGYDVADTNVKYDKARNAGVGWPRCQTIKDAGSPFCENCPHLAKGKSPLHLGTPVVPPEDSASASAARQNSISWDAADLKVSFSNIPHRPWLYGIYLIRGDITILAAPGGAGKTALAIGLAIEIAAGRELLGDKVWNTKDQSVLYLNGEDSGTEIRRRVWAFCRQYKVAEQDLSRLWVAGADDARVQSLAFLHANDKGTTVVNNAAFDRLDTALQELRPGLLVLDPFVIFCGGGDMNGTIMSMVMRRLKALAVKNDCAFLVIHHTRKGRTIGDAAGDPETISGAAAIVNLARRALMPVTMTEKEAKDYTVLPSKLPVLPSERHQYFKLVDAKTNLTPFSAEAPWYQLVNEELPNPDPPIYQNGDRVQVVKRAQLTREKTGFSASHEQQKIIRFEIMKLVDRGLTIDGEKAPYSPNSTGKNNKRAILDDAMVVIEAATPDREWSRGDLRASVERELEALKHDGWVVVEKIEKGRFRRCDGLSPMWQRTPWAKERKNLQENGGPTVRTKEEERELAVRDFQEDMDRSVGQSVNKKVND
jgi:hypothetical protein